MNRVALLLLLAGLGGAAGRTLATREFFYVGGKYTGAPGREVMAGQMYVEVVRPQRVTQRYPLVLFHGKLADLHQLDGDARRPPRVG